MADAMKPYADDAATMTIAGLTVENSADRISISGSLDIAKDRRGLEHARAMHAMAAAIVAALEAEKKLPEQVTKPKPAETTHKPNPFT